MRFRLFPLLVGVACVDPSDADGGPVVGTAPELGGSGVAPESLEDTGAAASGSEPVSCPPGVAVCNVTEATGLGSDGVGYGRGVALVDVDGDGLEDVWRSEEGLGFPGLPTRAGLWRNLGGGRFARWDVGVWEDQLLFNWGGAWADYDSDGDPDLVTWGGGFDGRGPLSFWRNDVATTGRLTYVNDEVGVGTREAAWWGGAFADYDRDGDLDLVLTSMSGRQDNDWKSEVCGPQPAAGPLEGPVTLFRNRGDGTFEDVTDAAGLPRQIGSARNPVWFDGDQDGDDDLFLAVDSGYILTPRSYMLRNDGERFVDVTAAWFDFPEWDLVFVAGTADFDQDGDDDLYLGRSWRQDYLLLNEGGGRFTRLGAEIGLDMVIGRTTTENSMGLAVGDLQGDGWPDLIIGPGAPQIRGKAIVLCNVTGSGAPLGVRFQRCSEPYASGHEAAMHHGMAIGDLDGDVDPDVLFNLGGAAFSDVIRRTDNRQRLTVYLSERTEASPNYAAIRLDGRYAPRDGTGARLVVHGSRSYHDRVLSLNGYLSSNGTWRLVSLGTATEGTVEVRWTSGEVTSHAVRAGERWVLSEVDRDRRVGVVRSAMGR